MTKKAFIQKISILVILLLTFFTGIYTYITKIDNNSTIVYLSKNNIEDTMAISENVNKENRIIELRKTYDNDNIVGELIIEGTKIKEPVVRYTDNDYYLHHNVYNAYEINGATFEDYRNDPNDKKVLIYGHSSVYESIPFNDLEKYYSKGFYEKHKNIKLITENKMYTYEIFSVYVETSDFSYVNLNIDDNTYNNHLKKYKQKSLYETGVEIKDNDEILILQTCSNSSKYKNYNKKYLLVIGRKVSK